MLTGINIANALATVAANVDGSFVTQNNAIFATGLLERLGSPQRRYTRRD